MVTLYHMAKPKILITNDDGILSPGLRTLWKALKSHADISIMAPAYDQSGVGMGVTIRTPLTIDPVEWEGETLAWKVNGTPADCVKLALGVVLKELPDLIVSGINRGSNAGRTVLYSGTVGGVIEGSLRRIPGIAFSYDSFEKPDYTKIASHILPIVQHTLKHPLPKGTILNVNFPEVDQIKGIKMARQGQSYWMDNPDARVHPEGIPYFWLGGKWADHEEFADSDVALLKDGYATVVPIHIDELTDHALLASRKEHFENFLASL